MTKPKADRDVYLDALKGLGICLVYLGHLLCYEGAASRFVFLFHVPLFFFVSGCLFRYDRHAESRRFWVSNFNGIIVPLLAFTTVGLVILALTGRLSFPDDDGVNGLYVRLVHNQSIGYNSAWFLTCLLLTRVSYRSAVKCVKRLFADEGHVIVICVLFLLVMFSLGRVLSKIPNAAKLYIPLSLASVPMAVYFFGVGNLLRRTIPSVRRVAKRRIVSAVVSCVLFAAAWWFASIKGHHANLAVPDFPKTFPFLLGSFCGIAGMFFAAGAFQCRLFAFIGRHSLCFFMAEAHVAYFCVYVLRFLPDMPAGVRMAVLLVVELLVASMTVIPMEGLIRWMREICALPVGGGTRLRGSCMDDSGAEKKEQ